jgi:hypothetical protein
MKRIASLVFFLALLFSGTTFAQEEKVEDRYAVLQDTMRNTSNQFVYSFFGKELLIRYLQDSKEVAAVEAASDGELSRLSAPFNSFTGSFVLGGLTLVYFLVVGYFIMRGGASVAEIVWLSQRKGSSFYSKEDYRGIALKMVVFVALAVFPFRMENPMIGDKMVTSIGNALLFDLMGRAHVIGDDALEDIVLNQRQTLASVELPNPDAKWASGLALNAFMTCLRVDGSRDNLAKHTADLKLYKTPRGTVTGDLVVGRCALNVTFGLDVGGDAKITRMLEVNPALALDDSVFAEGQKAAFQTVLSSAFNKAYQHSKQLAKPVEIETGTSTMLQDEQYIMRHWTIDGRDVNGLEAWQFDCPQWPAFEPGRERLSRTDKSIYHLLSARCISKDITQTLLYPEPLEAIDSILLNSERRRKTLPICVDTALFSQQMDSSRYVPVYNAGVVAPGQGSFEEIALESCLVNLCSVNSLSSGGMYACNGALDAYADRMKDVAVSDRGIMMLGLHMFNLFTHSAPSDTAKNVYNQTQFAFEIDGKARPAVATGDAFLSVPVVLPASSNPDRHNFDIDELFVLLYARENPTLPAITVPAPLEGGYLGVLGHTRLATCLQNPLQVENGYVCGNIPEEFSRFGMNVLRGAVALKSLLIAGDALRHTHEAMSTRGGGAMGEKTSAKATVTGLFGAFVASGIISSLVDNVMDATMSTTDDFGFLDQTQLSDLSKGGSVFAAAAATTFGMNSMVAGFFDTVLFLAMIIGFLFAIVMPLFPMILVVFALSKFVFLLVKTLLLNGFKLVDAGLERDTDLMSEKIDGVWADWLSLILKLPLTIAGVVLAWLMSNVIIASVTKNMGFSTLYIDGDAGFIDGAVVIVMSLGIVFVIYNTIMTVIESFYDFTVDWVLGQMTNSPFAERKAIEMRDASSVLAMVGRR